MIRPRVLKMNKQKLSEVLNLFTIFVCPLFGKTSYILVCFLSLSI